MTLKSWLNKRRKSGGERSPEIDDLITLGRLEEAERLLKARIKSNPRDRDLQRKLADLYMRTGRRGEAVDEYISVADRFAGDGFYDKALALLSKVAKLVPGDEKIPLKMEALRRLKRLERRRTLVIDSLLANRESHARAGTSAFELQRLWKNLVDSPLVEYLPDEQLTRLFLQMKLVHFEPGEVLAEEGDIREEIYLVAQGTVEALTAVGTVRASVLRSFAPGQLIGDRALLEHQAWPTTYRAAGKCALLRLTREGLEGALTGSGDPRQILDGLRRQRNDHHVAAALRKLRES